MASADRSYRLLAAKFLRKHAKALAAQLDGVCLADDIECVHQARVASRRLRAALRMFSQCFPDDQIKRWRKQIRKITSGLGDARDKDVQIEHLVAKLHEVQDPVCCPGIARLLVRTEQSRERLQPQVVKAVEQLAHSGLIDDLLATSKKIKAKGKAKHLDIRSPYTYAQCEEHILSCLDELLRYQHSLADAKQVQQHHAMRIAGKRLRYTVEIAKPVYRGQLDSSIEVVREIQDLLGDIHDCDVWLDHLDEFTAQERKLIGRNFGNDRPFARLAPGIEYLRDQRRRQRKAVFDKLALHWHQLEEQAVWDHLVDVARSRGKQPEHARPTAGGVVSDEKAVPKKENVAKNGSGARGATTTTSDVAAKLAATAHTTTTLIAPKPATTKQAAATDQFAANETLVSQWQHLNESATPQHVPQHRAATLDPSTKTQSTRRTKPSGPTSR